MSTFIPPPNTTGGTTKILTSPRTLPTPGITAEEGYFTIKTSPIRINATKHQILTTLLRWHDYPSWNSFVPQITDIKLSAPPPPGTAGSSHSQKPLPAASRHSISSVSHSQRISVDHTTESTPLQVPGAQNQSDEELLPHEGSIFTLEVHLFKSLPFKIHVPERLTLVDLERGLVAWHGRDTPAERVHLVKEAEGDGEYGVCTYESWETFKYDTKSMLTRYLLGGVLKRRFDEWNEDLKKAVEEGDW